MEHRAKTSLEHQIHLWKDTFAKKSEISKDNLEELESHLRDEIQQLEGNGLTEMEAFLVAKHRLGDEECLSVEYKKVNRFNYLFSKLKPYIIGAFGLVALRDIYGIMNLIINLVASKLGYAEFSLAISIVTSLVLIGILFVSLRHVLRKQIKFSFPKWIAVFLVVPVLNLITTLLTAKYFIDDVSIFGTMMRNKSYVVTVIYALSILVLIGIMLTSTIKKRKNLKIES